MAINVRSSDELSDNMRLNRIDNKLNFPLFIGFIYSNRSKNGKINKWRMKQRCICSAHRPFNSHAIFHLSVSQIQTIYNFTKD